VLPAVLADIERFHAEYGAWWEPAPLLQRLVREGRRFADLQDQPSAASAQPCQPTTAPL
jgi:3-hydroxyacyl-CoA dehydrogenase